MTASMELLTFPALTERIRASRKGARAADVIAGWDRLLEVIEDLGSSADTSQKTLDGRKWALVEVRVAGYQGIGTSVPLVVRLDPTPGVTVIHGRNGSGKSSLADAVETALRGEPSPGLSGKGGRASLWDRVHVGRDAVRATIDLVLASAGERLTIRCALGQNGAVEEWVARRTSGSSSSEVELARTAWPDAVRGHRPVFGYAAVERRVQRAGDLQEFLEGLLAFGGCFDALKEAVEARGEEAKEAHRTWQQHRGEAEHAVARVDAENRRDDEPMLDEVLWPEAADDPDQWLARADLMADGTSTAEVTTQDRDRLSAQVGAAIGAIGELERLETSILARLAGPLTDLHRHAATLDDTGVTCPVCDSDASSWLDTLGRNIDGLVDLDPVRDSVNGQLRVLRVMVEQQRGAIDEVVTSDLKRTEGSGASPPDSLPGEGLIAALDTHGAQATPDVRAAVRDLADWVASDVSRDLYALAAERGSHMLQWRRARRAAVTPFLTEWRTLRALAVQAPSWISAQDRLRTLQGALRQERSGDLRNLTDARVRSLLSDVGVTLRSVKVQGTKAQLEVVDPGDQELSLAMLSAGQRNALLLAPLLAAAGGGPFRFLVLDDPVHAFDRIRVDRLAALLHEIATNRRVVVLTHDERLAEHLAAHDPSTTTLSIRRDASSGVVAVDEETPAWRRLIEDAREALSLADDPRERTTVSPTDLVRGMCRQAVDTAVRHVILHHAHRQARDVDADLAILDAADTTKQRLARTQEVCAGDPDLVTALVAAQEHVEPYLGAWNAAAHGNVPASAVVGAEIDAAQDACELMLARP